MESVPGAHAIHAGTKRLQGRLATAGGRVLGMVGQGASLQEAIQAAYAGLPRRSSFPGIQFRTRHREKRPREIDTLMA